MAQKEGSICESGIFPFEGKSESLARVKAKISIQNHIYFIIYQCVKLYHSRYSRSVSNRLFVSLVIQSIRMIYKMLDIVLYRF